MFGFYGDDVFVFVVVEVGSVFDGEVVGFGSIGCLDDFVWVGVY